MINSQDILTSQGKYPEREKHIECTVTVRDNSERLAKKVSALLEDFFKRWVSSGFRTQSSNAKTKGAALLSRHMKGSAIDLLNLGAYLKKDYLENKEKSLLVKHDLYLEDPDYTPTWTHLQDDPPRSGKRVFIP